MLANPERTIAILREAVRDKRGGGWRAAQANWGGLAGSTHSIRSSILLPPNPRFEDFATEVITRPDRPARDLTDVEVRAGLVQGGIMGLAIQAFQFAEPSRGRSKSVVVGKSLTQKIVIKKAGLGIHGPGLATQTSSVPSTDADFELVLEDEARLAGHERLDAASSASPAQARRPLASMSTSSPAISGIVIGPITCPSSMRSISGSVGPITAASASHFSRRPV